MNWLTYMKYMLILKWNELFQKKDEKPGPVYIYEQDIDNDK